VVVFEHGVEVVCYIRVKLITILRIVRNDSQRTKSQADFCGFKA